MLGKQSIITAKIYHRCYILAIFHIQVPLKNGKIVLIKKEILCYVQKIALFSPTRKICHQNPTDDRKAGKIEICEGE